MTDVWVSWSGGKDAAAALAAARAAGARVTGLLATTGVRDGRPEIPVHGVPRSLVAAQAEALGLPLHTVELPTPCPDGEYTARMRTALGAARAAGVSRLVCGDLALADVRAFREAVLAGTGVDGQFPLWGTGTAELARRIVADGLRAVVVAVDPARVPATLAGRSFDDAFLDELPAGADPCGENGEFHTFVTGAPWFGHEVAVTVTGTVERDGHVQAVLAPAGAG
ncbi:ATP-binding protein [Pseudonocardia sp. NPDC049635]|uniref:Dph6-related ATP pyrophosphatase n=1 Tax=Pseudonocardia sp. NPDC049635 TaxID=3155506 RepID=UPI0033CA51A4